MMNKKDVLFMIVVILVGVIFFTYLGRQYPLHRSDLIVGDERIYYRETSHMIYCEMAYLDVSVYTDDTYEYYYDLTPIGNGSCLNELYIWDGVQSYRLSEAIDLNIITIDDFLESNTVKKEQLAQNNHNPS